MSATAIVGGTYDKRKGNVMSQAGKLAMDDFTAIRSGLWAIAVRATMNEQVADSHDYRVEIRGKIAESNPRGKREADRFVRLVFSGIVDALDDITKLRSHAISQETGVPDCDRNSDEENLKRGWRAELQAEDGSEDLGTLIRTEGMSRQELVMMVETQARELKRIMAISYDLQSDMSDIVQAWLQGKTFKEIGDHIEQGRGLLDAEGWRVCTVCSEVWHPDDWKGPGNCPVCDEMEAA